MLVQTDFIKKIKDFGLNSYEAKIWTALLSRGVSTAGELSDIANVPRSRSYDVLESLEKKGFIIMKIGKPIKYIAVPPTEVIDRVKKRLKEDAERQEKIMEDLKESTVLNELTSLHTQGVELVEPTDLSGSVRGRDNIYDHMELLLKDAEEEVIFMTTTKGLIEKADALKRAMKKAVERGVKLKIAAPITKDCKEAIVTLKGLAEIRHIPDIKARFIIVDKEQIFFMLLDTEEAHPNYDVGIWVNTKLFSSALSDLFHLAWKELKSAEQIVKISN
jgi:HTH-type transcriptional regulator, sugar sensing transcriptional regulator